MHAGLTSVTCGNNPYEHHSCVSAAGLRVCARHASSFFSHGSKLRQLLLLAGERRVTVIRSPRSKVSFFSLGDFEGQVISPAARPAPIFSRPHLYRYSSSCARPCCGMLASCDACLATMQFEIARQSSLAALIGSRLTSRRVAAAGQGAG